MDYCIQLLEPGDAVIAIYKGFDIQYDLMLIGVKLNISPFVKKKSQLPVKM